MPKRNSLNELWFLNSSGIGNCKTDLNYDNSR